MFMVVYVSCYDKVDLCFCGRVLVCYNHRFWAEKGNCPTTVGDLRWGLTVFHWSFGHVYLLCVGVFMWVVVSLCLWCGLTSTCCDVLNVLCLYVCMRKVPLCPSPRCGKITSPMHVQEWFTITIDPEKWSRLQCGRTLFVPFQDVLQYVIRLYCGIENELHRGITCSQTHCELKSFSMSTPYVTVAE